MAWRCDIWRRPVTGLPKTLTALSFRRSLAFAGLLGGIFLSVSASAQNIMANEAPPGPPPGQGGQVNPICPRLGAQPATTDGGGSTDRARDEQTRRYQDAAAKQQAELDRVTLQAKRMGCESSGFFSLFNGQSAQCGPVN